MPKVRNLALMALLTTGALIALATPGAGAQEYVGGLSVSNTTPAPGSQVTVRVAGVTPNQPAHVVIDDTTLAAPTADANGIATQTVTIPATLPVGEHLLAVQEGSGSGGRVVYSRALDVQAGLSAFSRPDGRSTNALLIGALLVVGAVATLAIRRSRVTG